MTELEYEREKGRVLKVRVKMLTKQSRGENLREVAQRGKDSGGRIADRWSW